MIAAWLALPWDPNASGLRKLLVPVFLLSGFALGQMTTDLMNFFWVLAFYPVAVANGVFLFGFARGVAYAAVTLPLMAASVYITSPPGLDAAGVAFLVAVLGAVGVFVIGVCKAIVDAVRSRQEARALVGELESANGELERRATKIKELAISEERARIAREVHDSLGHHLTAINLQLQNAQRFEAKDHERSRKEVREAREAALSGLAEVRRSVRALKPPALEERSGVAALAALARSFDGAGLDVSFELEGGETALSEEVELVLYRATQEGLTNAAKHSHARRSRVKLVFEPEQVRLTITDDGDGAPEATAEDGFGLPALRERVEALGGTLSAGNRPGGGFGLEITLSVGQSSGSGGG